MNDEDFAVRVIAQAHTVVLRLEGDLDIASAKQLVDVTVELLPRLRGPVELDCEGVRFADSGGLRALVALHNSVQGRGYSMRIVNPSAALHRLLQITGLDGYLDVEAPNP